MGWLGRAAQADGNLEAAMEVDRRALAMPGASITGALVYSPLTLYLAGELPSALKLSRKILDESRSSGESSALIYALTHYGLALAANGDFRIADTLTPTPPSACASPVLLIRNTGGAWFAAGILKLN